MRAFFWAASIFTIFGVTIRNLVQFWESSLSFERILLVLALVAAIVLAALDLRAWWKNRAKRYKTEESVNKYMLRLLERGGSAAIFANHLSWVRKSPSIRELLVRLQETAKM